MRHSLEKLAPLLEQAPDDVPPSPPYRHLRWTDPSGSSVAVHTRGGVIECVTPWFAPGPDATRWRVRTGKAIEDAECIHCSGAECEVLDEEDGVVTRAAIQWLHYLQWEQALGEPLEIELEVVAFADEASFFASREEFERAQAGWWESDGKGAPRGPEGRPLRFADNAFVPLGMFGEPEGGMGERASAMLGGRVEASERRTVGLFGASFDRVQVRSLPGLIDVLIAVDPERPAPPVGHIAWIQVWLVGQPVGTPPQHERLVRPAGATRRNWWARLLRKKG